MEGGLLWWGGNQTENHQTFQVPKMDVLTHLHKLYGYSLGKGKPTSKIAVNKVQETSILGTWNSWWENFSLANSSNSGCCWIDPFHLQQPWLLPPRQPWWRVEMKDIATVYPFNEGGWPKDETNSWDIYIYYMMLPHGTTVLNCCKYNQVYNILYTSFSWKV